MNSCGKDEREIASGRKKVALICPTMWDDAELPGVLATTGYEVMPYGTDVSEHPDGFDALSFIDNAVAALRMAGLHGVMASDDYPGSILAAAIAQRLGLPGPGSGKVLLCQHKYYSRLAQRAAVPEAVPSFALVRGDGGAEQPQIPMPAFVKPVKSFFSILAQRVDTPDELRRLAKAARPHLHSFVKPFNVLLQRFTDFPVNGSHLIAERVLDGAQVTVECCMYRGEFMLVGITDSVMYPGTISFARFEYPSRLGETVQRKMSAIAGRCALAIGLDNCLFNVEMFYNEKAKTVHIIEINPRMCPQFADMMEKVNGVNTYEIALAIASGVRPVTTRKGARYRAAVSYVPRLFEDRLVRQVPDQTEIDDLLLRFPDARFKLLCAAGRRLSSELQDGKSYRYALLNMGGESRADAVVRCEVALRGLTFRFDDPVQSQSARAISAANRELTEPDPTTMSG
ncbi:ATP-grasp domain protein (plasmid) [Paraburkholderia fungorum]|jgi:biotin carboxylase|nr:ATP-grasp domain-containing protein [Paraburkholderia fungorum]AJZ56387.1 ATP-grasp domain protein [Paraburkholderia fungorum]MBB5545188.1 biotin carboxylase [Paraburkholderia fungorum]MDE1006133.1 ATP-grasp domain-containing protein [Paraburkholderia fungorum]PRZ52551.1 D-alanine-D-alanine ligase-like ATP-grasp enzyme [Paraburkholderia fungorum]USX03180.1 ATP-grasp domain-containing protein [Paraburkholderia fungorum]